MLWWRDNCGCEEINRLVRRTRREIVKEIRQRKAGGVKLRLSACATMDGCSKESNLLKNTAIGVFDGSKRSINIRNTPD